MGAEGRARDILQIDYPDAPRSAGKIRGVYYYQIIRLEALDLARKIFRRGAAVNNYKFFVPPDLAYAAYESFRYSRPCAVVAVKR